MKYLKSKTIACALLVVVTSAITHKTLMASPSEEYEALYYLEVGEGETHEALVGYRNFVEQYASQPEASAFVEKAEKRMAKLQSNWPILNEPLSVSYLNLENVPTFIKESIARVSSSHWQELLDSDDPILLLLTEGGITSEAWSSAKMLSSGRFDGDIGVLWEDFTEVEANRLHKGSGLSVIQFSKPIPEAVLQKLNAGAVLLENDSQTSLLLDPLKNRIYLGESIEHLSVYRDASQSNLHGGLVSLLDSQNAFLYLELNPDNQIVEFIQKFFEEPFSESSWLGKTLNYDSAKISSLQAVAPQVLAVIEFLKFEHVSITLKNSEKSEIGIAIKVQYPTNQYVSTLASLATSFAQVPGVKSANIHSEVETTEKSVTMKLLLPQELIMPFLKSLEEK